jgi:hypothetical protein
VTTNVNVPSIVDGKPGPKVKVDAEEVLAELMGGGHFDHLQLMYEWELDDWDNDQLAHHGLQRIQDEASAVSDHVHNTQRAWGQHAKADDPRPTRPLRAVKFP